jgi:hypothetical protein
VTPLTEIEPDRPALPTGADVAQPLRGPA